MIQTHVKQVRVALGRVADAHAAHDAAQRAEVIVLHRDGTAEVVPNTPDPKRKGTK